MNYDCNELSILRDYLNQISKYDVLTQEEEKNLLKKIKNGDKDAKEKFINSNLRLVIKIANKYRYRKLSFMELIQEGNIGLIECIDKFDLSLGTRFSTYAVWWINLRIQRAVYNNENIIRIPIFLYRKIFAYKNVEKELMQKLNRIPTEKEINELLNYSDSTLNLIHFYDKSVISSNLLIGDGEDELETLISSTEETPEDIFIKTSLKDELEKLLNDSNLTSMEKDILIRKEVYKETYEMIGKEYNLSYQRIRQIEIETLRKIRKVPYIKEFLSYSSNPVKGLLLVNRSKRY